MAVTARMYQSRFRDWFFDRLIWNILSGLWVVKIKDFKKSKKKSERCFWGQMVPDEKDEEGGTIYLDVDKGTPRVLLHELGHVFFNDVLDTEARDKNKTVKKIEEWGENQILLFERRFFFCLTVQQIRILKSFIDLAQAEYKSKHRAA